MSNDSSFLKNTLDLIENDPEIKSYIYQQIQDFNPFVTPETLVMVIARDPFGNYERTMQEVNASDLDEPVDLQGHEATDEEIDGEDFDEDEITDEMRNSRYRIAIVLKDGDHSIEAEAFNNDIFEAIRTAKEALLKRLLEIQEEIESPQERMAAIQQAFENKH